MDNETHNLSGNQSPTKNPFCSTNDTDEACFKIPAFRDGGPSFGALIDEDFITRESLGILPSTFLVRDSLTSGIFSTNTKDLPSPRESLGILNLSSLDIGRESLGIFTINNPMFRREFGDNERRENQASSIKYDFENMISPSYRENPVPQILLSSIEDKMTSGSLADFNKGFLFPHSRKISGASSAGSSEFSVNPSFNSRSLEEPSKISSAGSLQKDLDPSMTSALGNTDLLNNAFHLCLDGNFHSASYKSASTDYSFASELDNIRNRLQSLPSAFGKRNILESVAINSAIETPNFDGVYRGLEEEKNLDDSVFINEKKRTNEDTSINCEENSFDGDRYLLDCTPQPDWTDLDSSKSNMGDRETSPAYNREIVSKKVDKMLGMQPVNLQDKLKFKSGSKSDSASSVDVSRNISKISRASQCSIPENPSYATNNFSQDLSNISRNSKENVSLLIKNLFDIINEKDNLSESQKNEGHHILHNLAGLLCDDVEQVPNSEDSGHSSVEGLPLGKKSKIKIRESNENMFEALDLSCKHTSEDNSNNKMNNSLSRSKSPSCRNPPPYVVYSPNHAMLVNTSTNSTSVRTNEKSTGSCNNTGGNNSNNSSASIRNHTTPNISSFRRHSTISQSRISLGPEKIRKSKLAIASSKKEPLRAVLPVENMAKNTKISSEELNVHSTPERNDGGNKLVLRSKKTSTPLQEPKLKPMASSTPASRQSKGSKQNTNTGSTKLKLTRSLSYQARPSVTPLDNPSNSRKSGESNISKNILRMSNSKVEGAKFVRRNSVTGNTLNPENSTDGFGSPRLKRSFSTGKEPKIVSALSRVRQNILNSPYYNPRKSLDSATDKIPMAGGMKTGAKMETDLKNCSLELKSLSKNTQSKKGGKENVKP